MTGLELDYGSGRFARIPRDLRVDALVDGQWHTVSPAGSGRWLRARAADQLMRERRARLVISVPPSRASLLRIVSSQEPWEIPSCGSTSRIPAASDPARHRDHFAAVESAATMGPSGAPPQLTGGAGRCGWTAVAAGIVLARSAVFAAFDGLDFDSDQAVFGLMAKHLAEGRAFPLFMYGQSYMLAVSAWLAAPCVALLGATVFALKLPILAFNMAAAALLVVCLVRDARLAPASALVAALPFVLPPVVTTAQLTEHCGGNVEPFLYVLLLWLLRRRAIAFGVVAGIGTLNREFTLYGVAALAVLAVASGRWRERATLRFASLAALCFAGVLALVELVRPLSTYGRGLERAVAWKGFEAAQQRLVVLVERMLGILFGFQPLALATEHLRSELSVSASGPVLGPLLAALAACSCSGCSHRRAPAACSSPRPRCPGTSC